MHRSSLCFLSLPFLAFGCSETVDVAPPETSAPPVAAAPENPAANVASPTTDHVMTVALTEANTKVQFVGTHVGEKPDPRTGTISKLTGSATADAAGLKSLTVEFDMESVTTEFDKLTEHLKSPDFFDVREFPTAKFQSTSINKNADGTTSIVGDLTLLKTTKQITIPATADVSNGLKMTAEFTIDRSEFGMTFGVDKVDKAVKMTVNVGG